ncbi:hypothetical protein GCM10020227_02540 [Streptomyces flavovirens]
MPVDDVGQPHPRDVRERGDVIAGDGPGADEGDAMVTGPLPGTVRALLLKYRVRVQHDSSHATFHT